MELEIDYEVDLSCTFGDVSAVRVADMFFAREG
jgi:hypothetical protein